MNNSIKNIQDKKYLKVITDCMDISEKGNYIYRGTNQMFAGEDKKIQSSLYRYLNEQNENILDVERDTILNAKHLFQLGTNDIKILTELRHYGERLTVIDFTRNLFVALFFACQRTIDDEGVETNDRGEIILLEVPKIGVMKNINYENFEKAYVFEPAFNNSSYKRVMAQSSIFVHAPQGFIDIHDPGTDLQTFEIKSEFKKPILKYLKKYHDIESKTIFRDVIGFIQNKMDINPGKYQLEVVKKYLNYCEKGDKLREEKNYEDSINEYSKAIKYNPNRDIAYFGRAIIHMENRNDVNAILDLKKAIKCNPNNQIALITLGGIYLSQDNLKEAFNQARRAYKIDNTSKVAKELYKLVCFEMNKNIASNVK